MSETKPTQFRLSKDERDFLDFHGQGNMATGLRNILLNAGLNEYLDSKKITIFLNPVSGVSSMFVAREVGDNDDARVFNFDNIKKTTDLKKPQLRKDVIIKIANSFNIGKSGCDVVIHDSNGVAVAILDINYDDIVDVLV